MRNASYQFGFHVARDVIVEVPGREACSQLYHIGEDMMQHNIDQQERSQ